MPAAPEPPPPPAAPDADALLARWPATLDEARAIQERMRAAVVLAPPAGFAPRRVAGVDLSMDRGSDVGVAGIVVVELPSLDTVETVTAVARLPFPYVPGFLSFRELPAAAAAWARLTVRPDVVIFDGQGYAHPRRFGVACHGAMLFGVPGIGCAKSILVGRHAPLEPERGARAPLVHRGETVGTAVRLRAGVQPVFVSPGHRMDVATAVAVVEAVSAGFREPETTRRAHRAVNAARRALGGAGEARQAPR